MNGSQTGVDDCLPRFRALDPRRENVSGMSSTENEPPAEGGEPPLAPESAAAIALSVNGLFDAHPALSARRRFSLGQRIGLIAGALGLVAAFVFAPITIGTVLMSVGMVVYTAVLGMRLDLLLRSRGNDRFSFTTEELDALADDELPRFTILVPAYKEPEVLPHLVENLAAFDYPIDKLQILLLLESNDPETRAAAEALDLQAPFEVIVVPPGGPQTKPKALNYALFAATGDVVTIYDAEDRPDPLQLRKVAATLAQCGPEVACVQAELAYFNADENIITRWFATEYRMWFTQFLPSLSRVDAPIPLGGTSNHFRRDLLVQLGAWDPYNVTEDADLGIRLRRQGYRVAVLDSTTYEEANTDFINWIKQRSRWYKGYAQTWLVHMRHPRQLFSDLGLGGFVRFNLFVGGTPLLAAVNPISWILLVLWFTLRPQFIVDIMPAPVYYSGLFGWIVGNFIFYYLNLQVAYESGVRRIFKAAVALPVYWVMMALAATKAFIQLLFNPSYWEKTQHGLSRQDSSPQPPPTRPQPPADPPAHVAAAGA